MRVALTALLSLVACDASRREATMRVSMYGEPLVEDGIPGHAFVDGWSVDFSRFLVSVSDVAADDTVLDGARLYDLSVRSMGEGHLVGELEVPAGPQDHLEFRIAPATTFVGGNTPDDDRALMLSQGHSIYAEGRATRGDDVIAFAWGFDTQTRYSHCHIDQDLADGDFGEAQMTIHADHLFYDDLDSEEPNIAFDLLAAADTNADGRIEADELAAVDIRSESRYQVGSRDISDLRSFVTAQTRTLGHIDGEGHCETR